MLIINFTEHWNNDDSLVLHTWGEQDDLSTVALVKKILKFSLKNLMLV